MRRPLVVLTLTALLAAAGCGGDDPLSAGEYRERANAICAESQRASDRIEQPTRPTPAAIADFFRRQLRINDRNVARFRALRPPDDLRAAHDRSVRALDAAGDEVRRIVGELDEGRSPTEVLGASRAKLSRLSAEQREAARALGVERCGD